MTAPLPAPAAPLQKARLTLRLGRGVRLGARLQFTERGLLAVGASVSAILLSTALLVGVAVREAKRRPG